MKYEVTYSCGHTGTVQIYGTAAEREKKIAWYENYAVCPDCYKKARQEEAATAAKHAKADGLPALTGSENKSGGLKVSAKKRWRPLVNGWPVIPANRQINAWPGTAAMPVPRGGLTTATNGHRRRPS